MKRVINSRALWMGGGLALLLAGCDGNTSQRPPTEQLQEGLNILHAKDPSWGLNAAYLKQGRAIYLETRVGAPKPDIYHETWPDDPKNEMDMRFVDQEGRTFFFMRGGDTFTDSSWINDIKDGDKKAPKVDLTLREQDFRAAVEMSKAAMAQLPKGFADHMYHLQRYAAAPIPFDRPDVLASIKAFRVANPTLPALRGLTADVAMTDQQYYWWGWEQGATNITLWSGSCCGGFGMHSATDLEGYQQGWFCNHGRCPGDGGLGNYGTTTHYPGGGSITGESNANNLATSGGCNSGYSWNTYSASGCHAWYCTGDRNTHLCNEDAEYEILEVYYGTWSTPYGDANNFNFGNGSQQYMCNCNGPGDNGGCNGDWNTPWLY